MLKMIKRKLRFLKRRLVSPRWPQNEKGQVWLHIGCGREEIKGFVNIDALPYPHVHLIKNKIWAIDEFSGGSVDIIYMCHVLEHFKRSEVPAVLREMYRLLKIGGTLFLSVPDFDKLVRIYAVANNNIDTIHDQAMGGQDNPYNIHYTLFSRDSLIHFLCRAGFHDIQDWDHADLVEFQVHDRSSRQLKVDDQRYPISLNVRAIKGMD